VAASLPPSRRPSRPSPHWMAFSQAQCAAHPARPTLRDLARVRRRTQRTTCMPPAAARPQRACAPSTRRRRACHALLPRIAPTTGQWAPQDIIGSCSTSPVIFPAMCVPNSPTSSPTAGPILQCPRRTRSRSRQPPALYSPISTPLAPFSRPLAPSARRAVSLGHCASAL
jgi:hypothetical protein